MQNTKMVSLEHVKKSILDLLRVQKKDLNIKQIGWAIDLKGSKYVKKINRALMMLEKENLIIRVADYKFRYQNSHLDFSGVIDINSSGNGYVTTQMSKEDVFIKNKNTLNALHQDTVSIKLIGRRKKKLEGVVTRVLSRAHIKFIGRIKKEKNNYFFIADNNKICDFFVPKENLKNAKNKDRVIIEFSDWPTSAGCPFGRVVKIFNAELGLQEKISACVEIFNIRNSFSKAIQHELKQLNTKISDHELVGRRDFRNDLTFTIDPADAKDFDDAISIKFLKKNEIQVGIHIADVAHYIKPNSEIDKEAFLRSFSVYFPGRVIPMLPEKLSNQICSLRPQEDKLSFSIIINFNTNNKINSVWMGKGVINSNQRFTYNEVENIIQQREGQFSVEILALNNIASELKSSRINSGSIDFQRKDIKFELNQHNEPTKVTQTQTLGSQSLVEELMLLANKLVATKLKKLKTSLYRVHDLPDPSKIKEIGNYLNMNNLKSGKNKINLPNKNLHVFINKLLAQKEKNINHSIIENLILRAMAKAKYSTKNIGHYGLGFEYYTHFTSPIRRYADLIIHRLLDSSLKKKELNLLDLEKQCVHFSSIERVYLDVERKINKFIQLKLLENKIGCTFTGFISGLQKWGIYVELEDGQGEGLIGINKIGQDNYYYNDSLHSIIGRKSGEKYTLGQEVSVEIKSVDLFKQELDLAFAF